MSNSAAAFYESWPAEFEKMRARAPELARAFGGLFMGTMKEGALTVRDKELIALGVALAVRCHPCIYTHVDKCLKAGATPTQVLEAAAVAVMMQGAPTYTHVPEVIKALDHLEGRTAR